MDLAYIPSPSQSAVSLGPLKLHAYALCIILGVIVAIWLGSRRWVQRGGRSTTVGDIALWAVPFGLVGGRLYHVVTDYQKYFGAGKHPIEALYVWNGGLGIWGAVAFGAVGAWIGCRRRGIALPAYADAVAPGIVLAQAIGRWGNWFNQELFGRPSDLPWAVRIDAGHPGTVEGVSTYQPTFLYEFLWCVAVGLLVLWADRRFTLGHGRVFGLYVAAYTVGRFWIEYLRIDDAHHFFGLRLNDWTSILVFVLAVAYIVVSAKRHPGRELTVEPGAEGDERDGSAGSRSGGSRAVSEDAADAETSEDAEESGDSAVVTEQPSEDAVTSEDAEESGDSAVVTEQPSEDAVTSEDAEESGDSAVVTEQLSEDVVTSEDAEEGDGPAPAAPREPWGDAAARGADGASVSGSSTPGEQSTSTDGSAARGC